MILQCVVLVAVMRLVVTTGHYYNVIDPVSYPRNIILYSGKFLKK